MFGNSRQSPAARRTFLSRLGSGVAGLGAAFAGGSSIAQAQSAGSGQWQPARHAEDDWLDQLAGQHRFIFDTTTVEMATHRLAGGIAQSAGGNADAVYNELAANLLNNARLVPAGIVAVNRAQERGYSLAHGG